jgi:hypothetical protein
MKYGKLTYIRDVQPTRFELIGNKKPNRKALWRCDCGKEKTIVYYYVTSGNTRSCGCVAKAAWGRNIRAFADEHIAKKKARAVALKARKAGM